MLEHSLDHSGTWFWLRCGENLETLFDTEHIVSWRVCCVYRVLVWLMRETAAVRSLSFRVTFALLPLFHRLLNGCCAVRCNDQIRDAMLYHVLEQHARFCREMCGGAASQGRHVLCDAHRSFPQGACYGLRAHRCVYRLGDNLNVTGANRPCFEPNIFVANASFQKLCCRTLPDVSRTLESCCFRLALLLGHLHNPLP